MVAIEKKSGRKIATIDKTPDGREDKMKEKCLLRKLWTPIILNCCLTQHDKWLVRNSWKTFQTSRRGLHSSIETHHSVKLLDVLFWN